MADAVSTYEVRRSGLWNSTHRFLQDGQELGVLSMKRGRGGMVTEGHYSPIKGEVLSLRRDPGLLRSHFSLWTDGQEWLGSSLRGHFVRREIVLHTGTKPLRIQPLPGLRFGWTLQAPRTGQMARLSSAPFGRRARLEVFRKVDFELVVFTYFLGIQILRESWWPGPPLVAEAPPTASARPSAGT
jgi:hypothetical protein